MTLDQHFAELLAYDFWANRKWLQAIGNFTDLTRAHSVFEHILNAQRIWLNRVGVELTMKATDAPLEHLFADVNRAWQLVLKEIPLDQPIVYKNLNGIEFQSTFGEILSHVINHGTYHRGHLRGLAQAEGFENFPETDLILFFRERAGQ